MSVSNKKLKVDPNLDFYMPSQLKLLVNNEKFSDVSFSVGEKKQLIYAHKMVLASGSPVMEKMFFGNLSEKNYPINITDLTPNGFINMLRYIYGYDIDFDFSNLYDVYMAADKYLVYNLTDKIFEYIKLNLNEFNCCLIYDQLVKINKDQKSLDHVRSLVKIKTKEAFSSEFFKEISKECLIDILNMESLNIDEIDILRNCLNWIEAELVRTNQVSTLENKRSIFNEIKPFIRFSQITIQQLTDFQEIDSLLNSEEIGNLFLYLADTKRPIPFECKALRKLLKSFIANYYYENDFHENYCCSDYISTNSVLLNTNQEIIITEIYTRLSSSTNNLIVNFYNEKDEIIDVKKENNLVNDYWQIKIDNIRVVPNTDYKIKFEFNEYYASKYFSGKSKSEVIDNDNKIILNLNFDEYHCLDTITFLTIS